MIAKKQEVKTLSYTFSFTEEEMRWFKSVIDYGWHRAHRHENTPMSCYKDFLSRMKDTCNSIIKPDTCVSGYIKPGDSW